MLKDRRRLLIAVYVGIAIYVLPMFPHGGSANELTRWATAASIVETGSFDIGWMNQAIEFQNRGQTETAENALRTGKAIFPFAACEFGTNLAALYYTAGRKADALAELESVQPLVFPWSRPRCTRSRQLLDEFKREATP